MKPIILYTKDTCPAKTIVVPYKFPCVTFDGQPLFTEKGKPVKASMLKPGIKYEVKIK